MPAQRQRLRIIGGEHRGRTLSFDPRPGLRPTPDRVRETLFNWLQPVIAGAACLDMFAGSGLLGMEAASRGASSVTFIESDRASAGQIEKHLKTLGVRDAMVCCGDAMGILPRLERAFDIVFIDPPFDSGLLQRSCEALESGGLLKDNARIYMESDSPVREEEMPNGWHLARGKQAGQVFYHLAVKG